MKEGWIITIGTFDGVHIGHRAILSRVRERSLALRLPSAAYVFEIPPRASLGGDPPRLLLPPSVRYRLIADYVDRIIPAEFSAVRSLSPEGFIARIVVEKLNAREIIVGEGFRFGEGRRGDIETLRALAAEYGYRVAPVPPVTVDQRVVSSTLIRELISDGKIGEATRLLGRYPTLFGEVIRGDRIGARLGYPTANLRISEGLLLPAAGVYLARAFVDGERADGLLYVGRRPSVGGEELRCEIHLLSPPKSELYGLTIEVNVLERLREDRSFRSLELLRAQIGRDVERAHSRLRHYPPLRDRIGG